MAYVDGFEHDIFISYAHVDDETASEAEKGWVTKFYNELRVALRKHVHKDVDIWRDERRLDGSVVFDKKIRDALKSSAIFVALTSRGYLGSDYCKKELALFHEEATADKQYGLIVGDRRRIVNVLLTNIRYSNWPEEFGTEEGDRTSGFPFHDAEPDARNETSFPSKPEDPRSRFKEQLNDLTIALKELLQTMKEAGGTGNESSGGIFIADVPDTLRKYRRRVIAQLEREGVEIISNIPPPYDASEHDSRVKEVLQGVELSVHLLDESAGPEVDDAEETTYPQRQADLAIAHARARMFWAPGDLDIASILDEDHRAFMQRIEDGHTHDFIRSGTTDITRNILEKIEELQSASEEETHSFPCLLVTHSKDTKYLIQVASVLLKKGIDPSLSQEANEPREEMKLFEERLRQTENLILFYGDVSIDWVKERLDMAIKLAVLEGLKLNLAIFVAPPRETTADVRDLWPPFVKVHVLDNTEEFNESTILSFLEPK